MLAWALSLGRDTDTVRNEVGTLQTIATWRGFRRERLVDPSRLPMIACPTLWLWGTRDPFAAVGLGRSWAAAMPTASSAPSSPSRRTLPTTSASSGRR